MERIEDHSKAKLALAVFTSPAAAFEEIARRKLLGTAIAIILLTGLMSMAGPLISVASGEKIQWLQLGRNNSIAWLGLCLLYAFAMQKLLKWIGAQVDYTGLVTLMGWAQLSLLIVQIMNAVRTYWQAQYAVDPSWAAAISFLCLVAYVAMMGPAIRALSGSPNSRGILSYLVIEIAAVMGFTITYGNARQSGFQHALPAVQMMVSNLVWIDQFAWAAAAVVGLALGLPLLGKHLGWSQRDIKLRTSAAAFIGLVAFGGYTYGMNKADYYGRLAKIQGAYRSGRYADAGRLMARLLRETGKDANLTLETGNLYYLAGDTDKTLGYYGEARKMLAGEKGQARDGAIARIDDLEGMTLDAHRDYDQALAKFEEAAKLWPEFREPWIRMAVTYDRMGNYDRAIESGNHAVKKLDSEAVAVWVALAEAFTATGDTVQAKAAIAMVAGKDKKLAERIGSTSDDWKTAVDKLTREDLKFPLEKQLVPEPKKAEKGKKK